MRDYDIRREKHAFLKILLGFSPVPKLQVGNINMRQAKLGDEGNTDH